MTQSIVQFKPEMSERQAELVALARVWWRNGHNSNDYGDWPAEVTDQFKWGHDQLVDLLSVYPATGDWKYRQAASIMRNLIQRRVPLSLGSDMAKIAVRQTLIGMEMAITMYLGDCAVLAR